MTQLDVLDFLSPHCRKAGYWTPGGRAGRKRAHTLEQVYRCDTAEITTARRPAKGWIGRLTQAADPRQPRMALATCCEAYREDVVFPWEV